MYFIHTSIHANTNPSHLPLLSHSHCSLSHSQFLCCFPGFLNFEEFTMLMYYIHSTLSQSSSLFIVLLPYFPTQPQVFSISRSSLCSCTTFTLTCLNLLPFLSHSYRTSPRNPGFQNFEEFTMLMYYIHSTLSQSSSLRTPNLPTVPLCTSGFLNFEEFTMLRHFIHTSIR